MMQFNMYHHYTVDEHLIRSIGVLADIEAGGSRTSIPLANEIMPPIQQPHGALSWRCSCTTSPRAGRRTTPIAGARIAAQALPAASGSTPAETDTVAWLVEHHLLMSTIGAEPRPLRPQDDRDLRRHGADARAAEAAARADRLRHPRRRARACGTAGRASCCARSTGRPRSCWPAATPQIERAQRVRGAQDELREALPDWPDAEFDAYVGAPLPGLLAEGGPAAAGQARQLFLRAGRRSGCVRSPPRSRPTASAA